MPKLLKRFILFIFCFFVSASWTTYAYSQQASKKQPKREIKVRELVIKQRVLKPQAMFILTKSQQARIRSDITTSQNFSKEIIKTIEEDFLR